MSWKRGRPAAQKRGTEVTRCATLCNTFSTGQRQSRRCRFGLLLLFRVHEFGHPAGFALFIDTGEDAGTLGQQDAGGGAFKLVGMLDAGTGDPGAGGGQGERLIVKARTTVFGRQFSHDEKSAGFFQFTVSQAVDAQQFGAAHLEPHRVHRMMHHPRLIGLAVPRDDRNGVLGNLRAIGKLD